MANRADDFNRGDDSTSLGNPSDGGAAYTTYSSGGGAQTSGISSNRAYCSAGGGNVEVLEASSADVEVSLKIYGTFAAVAARVSGYGDLLIMFASSSSNLRYYRLVGGAFQDERNNSVTWSNGDTIAIHCEGDTITLKHNGSTLVSFTEATHNDHTRHGLAFYNGTSSGQVDDLSITDLNSSFSIDRATVLTEKASISLALTGTGTAWQQGVTDFTVSGVIGVSEVSQTVHSTTSATLEIETIGASEGTLTVDDGEGASDTVAVSKTATTVSTGNWATGSIWDTLDAPGTGNRAVIAHDVTVAASATIGDSPAEGTTVLTINAAKTLTIDPSVTFTVKGRIANSGTLQVGTASGGGTLEMDASGATDPTNQNYEIRGAAEAALFRTRGTTGAHSVIRSNASGGNAYIDGALDSTTVDCEWCDFLRIGDSTLPAIGIRQSTNPGVATTILSLTDCTFTSCGRLMSESTVPANASVSLTRCLFDSGEHAEDLRLTGSAPGVGVTRLVNLCSFAGDVVFSVGALAFTNCVMDGGYSHNDTSAWAAGDFDGNYVFVPNTVGLHVRGDVDGGYWLQDGTDNPHTVLPRDTGAAQVFENVVIEYAGAFSSDSGNVFYGGGTWTFQNCIVLPATAGTQSTGAVTYSSPSCKVVHCTLHSPFYAGGVLVGDGGAAVGVYPEVKSNLFWVQTAVTGAKAVSEIGGPYANDVVTPAGCINNGLLNMDATPYMGGFSTAPGDNDVTLTSTDPDDVFVDSSRNIATWAVSRGSVSGTYAGRVADARSYLRADPTLIPDLLAHVRAGFVVQHAPWRTAAHDGTVVGAIQDAPPAGGGILVGGKLTQSNLFGRLVR